MKNNSHHYWLILGIWDLCDSHHRWLEDCMILVAMVEG